VVEAPYLWAAKGLFHRFLHSGLWRRSLSGQRAFIPGNGGDQTSRALRAPPGPVYRLSGEIFACINNIRLGWGVRLQPEADVLAALDRLLKESRRLRDEAQARGGSLWPPTAEAPSDSTTAAGEGTLSALTPAKAGGTPASTGEACDTSEKNPGLDWLPEDLFKSCIEAHPSTPALLPQLPHQTAAALGRQEEIAKQDLRLEACDNL
jgi:hypothetical protein